jgi:glutamyl/glutaminyl-tRNA synthetase
VLLGWHPAVDREIIGRDDMVKEFTLERVQKAGAIFNPEKLEWLNAAYLKKISVDDLLLHLTEFLPTGKPPENREFLKRAVTLVRDRMKKLSEFTELAAFLFDLPEYPALMLAWKNGPLPATRETLAAVLDVLSKIPAENFSKEAFEPPLMRLAEERGRGETLWPLRVALSGQEASPGPIDLIDALGKTESERRITRAMEKLEQATLL